MEVEHVALLAMFDRDARKEKAEWNMTGQNYGLGKVWYASMRLCLSLPETVQVQRRALGPEVGAFA
jgi:hypothetical protein